MRAGGLRHKILIEKPVQVKSATGAVATTWTEHAQVWASIETFRSYERQSAEAAWPGADVKIGMRFVKGLLPTFRIVYDNKIYSILGINDFEQRHRDIEVTCKTGASAA